MSTTIAYADQPASDALQPIINNYSAYHQSPAWYAGAQEPSLPTPAPTYLPSHLLTLRDAIWLALRNNPDVKNAKAQRILDKFALAVAAWQFQPQFSNQFGYQKNVTTNQWGYSSGFSGSLATRFGTSFSAGYANTTSGIFNQSNQYNLTVTQPLLQGGWFIPGLSYLDAVDSEKITRVAFAQNIMDVVKTVIAQYTSLVQSYNDFDLQKEQLTETKRQLDQDFLKLKAGKMARSDYLQEEIQYEQNKLNIVIQQNTLQSNYQNFLLELGLVGSANVKINHQIDTTGFDIPSKDSCIAIALQRNSAYLEDQLTLKNDTRALRAAKNQLWPQVNVIGSTSFGKGQLPNNAIGLSVSIPINPMDTRESILQARIALEKQKIQLDQDRQEVISNVTNQWQSVHADLEQIVISKKSVLMQIQTVADNALLLKYGRTTMYDYLQIRNQLLSQQLSLVGNQISLINDVSALDDTMGNTLKRWGIQLRY